MTARVRSTNLARPKPDPGGRRERPTGIDKRPVEQIELFAPGPRYGDGPGVVGDLVGDDQHHGGAHKAVYAFAREDLDRWAERLGREVPDGHFGENLTTRGLDVNECEVGERWRIGTAVLEVASVRTPCNDFKTWQRRHGFDDRAWVRRFTEDARPGPYLRVVQEGELAVGDAVEVVHQPGHGVTVSTMFRALTTERALLPELLRVEGLTPKARRRVEAYVAG